MIFALSSFAVPATAESLSQEEIYAQAESYLEAGDIVHAAMTFGTITDYLDARERSFELWNQIRQSRNTPKESGEAKKDISDSQTEKGELSPEEEKYAQAETLLKKGDNSHAAMLFGELGDFMDARERSFTLWEQITQRETISGGMSHTVGLCNDGTVVAVGNQEDGCCNVSDWNDITAVSAGFYHTVGLRSDGTVVAVGKNDNGQCNVSSWHDIVAIAAGGFHTVGLRSDGTVTAIGYNGDHQCDVKDWTDIVSVITGGGYTLGLRSDGSVLSVGFNDLCQCNVEDWKNIVFLAAGDKHTLGLQEDGTVIAVGRNDYGQCRVEDWTEIVALAGGGALTAGLRSDGTVVGTQAAHDFRSSGQYDISEWTDIVSIAAGIDHTVGLKDDGTVMASGNNRNGQCDVAQWQNIMIPRR